MATIVLCGKSGSGKTTVAKELERYGYNRIITYTTRPIRPGERDGVDYHFVSENRFLELEAEGFFAETAMYDASFGRCYYGSSAESYGDNCVIVLTPGGICKARNKDIDIDVVFLEVSDKEIEKRLTLRGDNELEIRRRLKTDRKDFEYIGLVADRCINAENKSVKEITEEVING